MLPEHPAVEQVSIALDPTIDAFYVRHIKCRVNDGRCWRLYITRAVNVSLKQFNAFYIQAGQQYAIQIAAGDTIAHQVGYEAGKLFLFFVFEIIEKYIQCA